MAQFDKDEVPKLSETHAQQSGELLDSNMRRLTYRTRSASISIPMVSMETYERETNLVGHTGPLRSVRKPPSVQRSGPLYAPPTGTGNLLHQSIAVTGKNAVESKTEQFSISDGTDENLWNNNYDRKNEHLLRSGQLGMCNDPYCTTCPTYIKASQKGNPKASTVFDPKFHNSLYGDAKGFGRKLFSFGSSCVPGVMNPHAKVVQQWNKFLAIFCLMAIFVDPLFFFLFYVRKDYKCIDINRTMTKTLLLLRSINDVVYLLNILLQFRLAYVSPESRVVGAGDLVDHPKKIALNYVKGYFFFDLCVVAPIPQIMIFFVLPNSLGSSSTNLAKNLLHVAVLLQYLPRLFRFLPLLIGQSPTGFIFESAWANFVINLLIFMLSGHVVGSCWYLFGLQRVNQCLQNACHSSIKHGCTELIGCDRKMGQMSAMWRNNINATACLNSTSVFFSYGIYERAVALTTETKVVKKYVFALFWGFQQISTLAGNQNPSYFEWEVLFTMAIIALGLLLFALLIGNIQNFLQALGRRRLEMQLRGRDVEQWMSHRRLPEDLRRRVRQAERYNWAATRGVNEEMLLENLPEDLQTDIRCHLFKFANKVRIFSLMDEPILDAIRERLKQKTYIKGSRILSRGGLVEKMVFVVRGKLESIGEDGIGVPLCEGDACGEELLTWYLEHSSVSKDGKKVRLPGMKLQSNRTVRCLTNVEAFSLSAADLEEVTILFTRFLRSPQVQGAIRLAYVSPESTVVGAGDLVDHPKKIALNYVKSYFFFDLFLVLPLPQIMILFVLPNSLGSSGANSTKNLLRAAVLVQYIPRLFRVLPLLIGQSPTGFIFESAWANFIINLLIFMLSGHSVGSCWYLFGLQRVNQCLRDACRRSNITTTLGCMELIDCDPKMSNLSTQWRNNVNATACLNSTSGAFPYGIYSNAVALTTETRVVNKYVYALFWGFQQISTLAGNQVPSYFVWEVLFTMAIIGSGLLLFALLIGNIQNFLQALGRRRLEMQLRGRDVEQWMSHRRLPEGLRRRVRQAERYNWAATRGVHEEMLLENLPEDLQTDIRRHLFKLVKKVRIFALMDEPVLDAIRERLKQKTYIKGSRILSRGGLVEKMVFVVRGKLESIGEDGIGVPLSEGDACGEELLTWYLEHSSVSKDGKKLRLPGQRLQSNRTVRCLTNVEAFSLRAADLEEVTILFTRFLRSPQVQGALRYESPYWRSLAANRIQVAWRYRKKRLSRANTSQGF